MKYQFLLSLIFCSMSYAVGHKSENIEYEKKLQELEFIKNTLQSKTSTKFSIFDTLQEYTSCAGQVAMCVVSAIALKQKKIEILNRYSVVDKANIIQVAITCVMLIIEFARYCHAKKTYKSMIHAMNYQEFLAVFPHLILVEYQIILMKKLIDLTTQGTVPEQIFSRIQLTKMSLPYPYAKFCNKAAKKMYKKCFDKSGNFVWGQLPEKKHPYKKFRKKIPQSWQEIAMYVASFPEVIQPEYSSDVAKLIDTKFNNTLIAIIHAGVQNNLEKIKELTAQYSSNKLIQLLNSYYTF